MKDKAYAKTSQTDMIIFIELVQKRVMHGKHVQRHYTRYPKSPSWAVVMYINMCAQPLTESTFRIGTLHPDICWYGCPAPLSLYACLLLLH